MAINYQKVGWDSSSYVNPTNMNQMDDGIKAACDGVDQLNSNLSGINTELSSKLNVVKKGHISGGVQLEVNAVSSYLIYTQGAANQGNVCNLWIVSRRYDNDDVSIVPIIETWTSSKITLSGNTVTFGVSGYDFMYSIIQLV